MCGESWLAGKDSLIHHPSSQGWASLCPLVISYVSYNLLVYMYMCIRGYVYIVYLGCLSFLPTFM